MPAATHRSTTDLNSALGDARRHAADLADEVKDAAGSAYSQAVDSAHQVASATTKAARNTSGSFETALRRTIENEPYTAVAVSLAIGWLLGRMHRPL
jgi:ElaB/YqjD/DUF883 family membrane-anchored ribosome-binding protein